MAIKTKTLAATVKKWADNAAGAAKFYAAGVLAPKRPWQAATVAAEDNYEAGVQAAITDKRFGKGVRNSSDSEWSKMASGKGARNYPGGIRDGTTKYNKNMGPVLVHMQAITLPEGGPRGSRLNIDRSVAFQEQMAKFRTG